VNIIADQHRQITRRLNRLLLRRKALDSVYSEALVIVGEMVALMLSKRNSADVMASVSQPL
jgi:hypothetical protein